MSIDAIAGNGAALLARGKSQATPPGLEKRGLELPPGQAKRAPEKATPAGIAQRFPIAPASAPETPEETAAPEGGIDLSA